MNRVKENFDAVVRRRINWVLLFFFVLLGVLAGKIFLMQIIHYRDYVSLAARQHRLVEELLPERGTIFFQDKKGNRIPVALTKTYQTVIASPKDIENPDSAASFLAKTLNLDEKALREKLSQKDDLHEIIAKKIEPDTAEKIEARNIKGLSLEEEKRRVYPHGVLASHILGFVSKEEKEEQGRYGIERFYEEELGGKIGFFEGAKDAFGFWVALGRRIVSPQKDGADILLTVDYNIQVKTEEILDGLVKKWMPSSGSALVMDPARGNILALAGNPRFDPNDFAKEKDFSIFLNPVVESRFELGSVMKPFTMAAAIQERVVTPETTYEDTGEVKIGGYTIKNFDLKAHGTPTMSQVIEKSLNTGIVFVSRLLGKDKQREYLKRFGFSEKTGIDMPGEVSGDISNLTDGRDIDFATASFGQGIAVSPIELVQAFGAIANGGNIFKPYIVDRVIDDSGNEAKKEPQLKREVISKETTETITKMLVATVRGGFEKRAEVKGYFIAGKTGTAEMPRRDGKGYSDKVIHTVVGYAPAFAPRFLILLQMNEPQGNRFAANTLTPAFHDLAKYILDYYEIPPDEK